MTERSTGHTGDAATGAVRDRAGVGGIGQDWLGALITRMVRTAGFLQPDHPILPGEPVSLSETFALGEIANRSPLTQQDLAAHLGLEKSTVSRLVAGLERRGLVSRGRNPENRRSYQLTLTEHGHEVVHHLTEGMRAYHARILAAMTPAERDALAVGLGALLRAVEQDRAGHHAHGHTRPAPPE
jgi:DNA-binding MarR family transcriptional regulator